MEKYDLDTPTSSSVREKLGFVRTSSGRISFKRRVTMFCQEAVANAYFWIAVAMFTFIEPVLCGSYPTPAMLAVQFAVLSVSTLLFFMQLVGVAANEWDKINAIEALVSFKSLRLPRRAHSLSLVKLWIFFTAEGEYFFEGIILGYAWATLPWRPGLAVLRCFRVFRLLWYGCSCLMLLLPLFSYLHSRSSEGSTKSQSFVASSKQHWDVSSVSASCIVP